MKQKEKFPLLKKYSIKEFLGSGQFGSVYRAIDDKS